MGGSREEVKGQDDIVSMVEKQHKVFTVPQQQGGCDGELNSPNGLIRKWPRADSPAELQPCPASVLFPSKETATSHKLLIRLPFGC